MVKSESERHSKFLDIGARRTEDIIHKIRLLSNLSNTSNYYYTDEEVTKMFRSIKEEIRKAEGSFKGADNRFSF